MTVIEAMGCGTPTVITTEGGLCEQMFWGLESVYANPNDSLGFGMAIATVLMYESIGQQLAKHGSQKARSRFTWNGVAQQILNLLDDVEMLRNSTCFGSGLRPSSDGWNGFIRQVGSVAVCVNLLPLKDFHFRSR